MVKQVFNDDFEFNFEAVDNFSTLAALAKPGTSAIASESTLDRKIKQRRKLLPPETVGSTEDSVGSTSLSAIPTSEDNLQIKKLKKDYEPPSTTIQFADEIETDALGTTSFNDMKISRPLLKVISSEFGFREATPIQAACIPVVLQGRDICACAATGTGKTLGFMLPVLERLVYHPSNRSGNKGSSGSGSTRVLVLVPTRELAIQVYDVTSRLCRHTQITACLCAGGLDVKTQEAALRQGPDVVVATPGRLIDHLLNTPSFTLHHIEVLILDEADRMLDEYFAEQMKEVIRLCSRKRQTMLFSATMTDQVKDLAAVSLQSPVKIFVNQNTDVALNLCQEFVRIRETREGDREAILAALVKRTFHRRVMVFVQTKKLCQRLHILLGLLGINVGQLHGNLSQPQRMEALAKFKDGELGVLVATDLAARGLDIEGVQTVINFTMPSNLKQYVHRVGRTARAGKAGRAVSLVGEAGRKVFREIVSKAKNTVKQRTVPPEVITGFRTQLDSLNPVIMEIEADEQSEKELRTAEMQMNRANNRLGVVGGDGPTPLPENNRTWFQTKGERLQEAEALRSGDFDKLPSNRKPVETEKRKKKQTRQQQSSDEPVDPDLDRTAAFHARAAKRARRPARMRACVDGPAVKKRQSTLTVIGQKRKQKKLAGAKG